MRMYKYFLPEEHETIEDARDVPDLKLDSNRYLPEHYVVFAAENVWDNEDGWESGFPKWISVVENDKVVGCYKVDMEPIPSFFVEEEREVDG